VAVWVVDNTETRKKRRLPRNTPKIEIAAAMAGRALNALSSAAAAPVAEVPVS